jgi:hypothetical protein
LSSDNVNLSGYNINNTRRKKTQAVIDGKMEAGLEENTEKTKCM